VAIALFLVEPVLVEPVLVEPVLVELVLVEPVGRSGRYELGWMGSFNDSDRTGHNASREQAASRARSTGNATDTRDRSRSAT
jgi:hypothetical protein